MEHKIEKSYSSRCPQRRRCLGFKLPDEPRKGWSSACVAVLWAVLWADGRKRRHLSSDSDVSNKYAVSMVLDMTYLTITLTRAFRSALCW